MVCIARDQWKRVVIDSKVTARVICPGCSMVSALTHDIAEDGTVTPSVVCPFKGCGFHDNVKLEGWQQ